MIQVWIDFAEFPFEVDDNQLYCCIDYQYLIL